MNYHVTAPRLLFLYPRVTRVALSPDTARGQIIYPHLIEPDKDTFPSAQRYEEIDLNYHYKIDSDRIRRTSICNGRSRNRNFGRWETVIARHAAGSGFGHRIPREKGFHTATRCQQSIKPQRYGTANEPPPYLKQKKKNGVESRKERATDGGGIGDTAESGTIAVEGNKGKERGELSGKRNDPSTDKLRSMPGQQHLFRADGRLVEDSPDNEADEDVPDIGRGLSLSEEEAEAEIGADNPRSKQAKMDIKGSDRNESADNRESDASSEVDNHDNNNSISQSSLQQKILQSQSSSSSELLDESSQKKLLLRSNHHNNHQHSAHLSSSSSSSTSSQSPYFHHFDTYTMARNLQDGSFSEKQATTVMKAMRVTLTKNLEWAKNALVSKSNVENDTYLFRAACSELRTEVQNNRKKAADRMRNDRNQLEHEAEILNQRVQQESQNLKDNLKGMFDDRKMDVRMEQKEMESRIQELDYTITVALRSDARSAVEGLRWILVRRAAIAIVISAVMILATLRYSSYMSRTQEIERQKMEASQHNNNHHNNNNNNSSGGGSSSSSNSNSNGNNISLADYEANSNSPTTDRHLSNDTRQQSGDEEILVRAQEGNGPGYVSLG